MLRIFRKTVKRGVAAALIFAMIAAFNPAVVTAAPADVPKVRMLTSGNT